MNDVLIGISTYNEIENLPILLEQIGDVLPTADILVVDDNSPDGTGRWCDEQAQINQRLCCIHRSGKLGLGTATIQTMRHAIEHKYRFLINMDADLSHPPRFLPHLLAAMVGDASTCDVAVGSRYVPGGEVLGWPWHRRVMSRCVNAFARRALGLTCHDCSGSFRCYRVSKLEQIDLEKVRSRGYSFFEEILWHLRRADARFIEIPITFQDRERGQSKINLREAWTAIRIIATLGLQGRR